MDQKIKEKVNDWLNYCDNLTKDDIKKIINQNDENLVKELFGHDLEFGTGGMRGILGTGSSRMNKYTVGKATQGIVDYFNSTGRTQLKAVISYDTRNFSLEFAEIAAGIFCEHNFEVYLMKEPAPTPCLSFAVRHYQADVGIMITASHNPPEYNGYKVYNHTGCQIVPPEDKLIINRVNSIQSIKNIKFGDFKKDIHKDRITIIDPERFYNLYFNQLEKIIHNDNFSSETEGFGLVYTSLHGTGIFAFKRMVQRFAIKNCFYVKEQIVADGNFPTVKSPNPEERKSLLLSIGEAKKQKAELVIATDPDADRMGIVFLDFNEQKGNEFIPNGNEIGTMLLNYLLEREDPEKITDPYICNTIVTTDLQEKIAESHKVKVYRVLTGFKYIGDIINSHPEETYLFGGEESYGYLVGTHARDKDALASSLLVIEFFSYLKKNGISADEYLEKIYRNYGYYLNDLASITMEGLEGSQKIKDIMNNFRGNPSAIMQKFNFLKIIDYKNDKTGLPVSDVIQFIGPNLKITARPSGTEPKIKFYFQVNEHSRDAAVTGIEKAKKEFLDLLK